MVQELWQAPSLPRHTRRRGFLIRWKPVWGYSSIRSKILERVKNWASDPALPSLGPVFPDHWFYFCLINAWNQISPKVLTWRVPPLGILMFNVFVGQKYVQIFHNVCDDFWKGSEYCRPFVPVCFSDWVGIGSPGSRRKLCVFVCMSCGWRYQKCHHQVLTLLLPDGDTISLILLIQLFVRICSRPGVPTPWTKDQYRPMAC